MPLGYAYKERDADEYQINWAEIGKNMSDMLSQEVKAREEKRRIIDEDSRNFVKDLNNAPMGQYTPGNKFISDFSNDALQKHLMDYKLVKSGKMSVNDYTYNTQNLKDGTNTLFDLQKTYQDAFAKKMQGINDNGLQPLNTWIMGNVEGFTNFNKAKAMIDPRTGLVNLGIVKYDEKTGRAELTGDIMPVTVARKSIMTDIPAFKVDEALDNTKGRLGSQVQTLYNAATITGAGTLTKLLGVGAIKNFPQFKGVVQDFNKAIDTHLESLISDKYNLSSVLTMNTGKYDAESFTTDKELAKKDPTKILLKIDPSTQIPIMDEDAPYYQQQRKEAKEWMRTQLLGRLDVEVTKAVTPQMQQLRALSGEEMAKKDLNEEAANFGRNLGRFISGTEADKASAANYFAAYGVTTKQIGDKFYVTGPKGTIEYNANTPKDVLVSSMLKAADIPAAFSQEIVRKTANQYGAKSATKTTTTIAPSISRPDYTEQVREYTQSVGPLTGGSSTREMANRYNAAFNKLGFTFSKGKDQSGGERTGILVIESPKQGVKPLEVDVYKEGADQAINEYITRNQLNSITEQSGVVKVKGELDQ